MTEEPEKAAEMRIEHDESVRADDAHDRGGAEKVEAEYTGRSYPRSSQGERRRGAEVTKVPWVAHPQNWEGLTAGQLR